MPANDWVVTFEVHVDVCSDDDMSEEDVARKAVDNFKLFRWDHANAKNCIVCVKKITTLT